MKIKKIIFIIYFSFLTPLYSIENNSELSEIYKNLRCLICQGQSIADSNSEFASTIKLVVQDLISEGKTNDEIYGFLISKYGEWIVYQPTFNKMKYFTQQKNTEGGFVILFMVRKKQV